MWLARVYVTLKPTVNDPQGLAIRGGLHHLGFESVESVRAGKYLELRLDELEEVLGAALGDEDHEQAETLGGLIMARLGRIPEVGDEIEVAGRSLRVETLDGRRVEAVRLLPPTSEPATPVG